MTIITRQPDQQILIGRALTISPTDIDKKTVRLLIQGTHLGGPRDGERFSSTHELSKGQSLPLGPLVTVTVLDLLPNTVRLGILSPPHLPVRRAEAQP
jgi:sRNA-binding carbon storage regulator CsrA